MSDTRKALGEINGEGLTYIDDIEQIYELVEAFFQERSSLADEDFVTLFRLFEEFPNDDCSHVLWDIIHGIEHYGGYEGEMIVSLHKAPSAVPLLLVNRLLNGGFMEYKGQNYLSLLEEIAKRTNCPQSIADRAAGYYKRQQGKTPP